MPLTGVHPEKQQYLQIVLTIRKNNCLLATKLVGYFFIFTTIPMGDWLGSDNSGLGYIYVGLPIEGSQCMEI